MGTYMKRNPEEYRASRSVHFVPKMGPPPPNAFGRSINRKVPFSPSSSAPSTRSWVYPYNQHQAPAPPPQPVNVPSPVQELQPLPNPYPRKDKHRALHVVNATRNDEELAEDHALPHSNTLGVDFGYEEEELSAPSRDPPKKKKSLLGRVFGGVGRTVFPSRKYSDSESSPSRTPSRKLRRKAPYDSDPTMATYGSSMQNSQASISFDEPGPSNLNHRLPHPMTIPEESEEAGSPTPDVVRLSDNLYASAAQPHLNPTSSARRRVPVPEAGPSSHFVEGESSHAPNLAERTTVMIYESNPSGYQESRSHGQGPTPMASRQPSSRASHVNPEPAPVPAPAQPTLQPVRPTSFAPSVARVPVPPIDQQPSAAPTRRTSLASGAAAPPHSRQHSLNRGLPTQSPAARSGLQQPPLPSPMDALPLPLQPLPLPTQSHIISPPTAADIQSPVTVHPPPTDDYLKMAYSPGSNEQTVTSATTYSYDPSITSLSPFARFFQILYRMPWVAHDRVTVDYLPDEGLLGSKTKKKGKRLTTWYKSVLARSRRSSATMDLLGSEDRRKRENVDVSLGAALAGLGSPFFSTASRRRRGRGKEQYYSSKSGGRHRHHHHHNHNHRHHDRHHHSSSRHHRHHNRHHSRRRTTSTEDDDDTIDSAYHQSPLIPAMYPYTYPSYPIPAGYAAYPLSPNHESTSPATQTTGAAAAAGGKGMRSMTATAPVYATTTPQGYGPYAPVYVFQPTAVGAGAVPPVLVPGTVDLEHGHGHGHGQGGGTGGGANLTRSVSQTGVIPGTYT